MFGYVRPAADRLSEEDRRRYQAAYCGLCHTLGERYGLAPRLFLNYDFAFLTLLLDRGCALSERHCMVHPVRRRPCACRGAALETAADLSVILLWWQLRDGVADHGFFRGLKYRAASLLLRRAYRKARALRPTFDEDARRELEALARLERERCPSIDLPADRFARLLSCAAQGESDPARRRVLEQLLYHLGRWIYLVDAADDLERDLRRGCYNPLGYRFSHSGGKLTEESREELSRTLDQSVRQMAAAFELADFGANRGVVESVVYEGLYLVGGAVLSGEFHRRMKKTKR